MLKTYLIYLSVLTGLVSAPTFAQLNDESGFSGKIAFLSSIVSSESNFNMDTATKSGVLNSTGKTKTKFMFSPLGEINYTFGGNNDQQIFFGTSESDVAVGDLALEVGYKRELQNGMIMSASFLPTIMAGETWEDPYLIEQERKITDVNGNAYRIRLDYILGSDFSADLAYYTSDVDKDLLIGQNQELARDGKGVYYSLSYNYLLTQTSVILPELIYSSFSADGKAMSNTTQGIKVAYQHMMSRRSLSISAKYLQTRFNAGNSAFNDVIRKDSSYRFFAAYEFEDIMGWKNWSAISLLGYDITSSNITFYNNNEYLVSVGISYTF
ncbi:DUF2860 domain-containing protein [Vibrio brasiliensis]|uniref:DUF2860 family protein n=1 Tax=Vibrio brasiliensis TaxID=170652 RepID=UPI001EFE7348|nr:DUF2860 family protein [Vibrio brasiliensis]MCG9785458.1 DUF2860 domain-containing protein [Vibrio brasiliensis]